MNILFIIVVRFSCSFSGHTGPPNPLSLEWVENFEDMVQTLVNKCLLLSILSFTLNHIPIKFKYRRPDYCHRQLPYSKYLLSVALKLVWHVT